MKKLKNLYIKALLVGISMTVSPAAADQVKEAEKSLATVKKAVATIKEERTKIMAARKALLEKLEKGEIPTEFRQICMQMRKEIGSLYHPGKQRGARLHLMRKGRNGNRPRFQCHGKKDGKRMGKKASN